MRLAVLVFVLVFLAAGVSQAQAPTLQLALQEAQANLSKRAQALAASDVYKDWEAAKKHVATVEALVKADEAKTGSK